MRLLKICLFVSLLCSSLLAATIRVPQDQSTIQAGINAAVNGDTVLVGPGVWVENLDFLQKTIVLTTLSGADSTILQGAESKALVNCNGNIGQMAELSGFKFTNTSATNIIEAQNGSQVRILRNKFVGLIGDLTLIFCNLSNPTIERNVFCFNTVGNACIGIYTGASNARIVNNTFFENSRGFYSLSNLPVAKNNIVANSAEYGVFGTFSELSYNDVYMNVPNYEIGAVPGFGSISSDPSFMEPLAGDLQIRAGSPCIDAGDPNAVYEDPDGTRNDIGASCYTPSNYPFPSKVNFGLGNKARIVRTLIPTVFWSYIDTSSHQQIAYEIEVGTDSNWDFAELWQPGPVMSPDTSATYAGTVLSDQTNYFLRVKIANDSGWGEWVCVPFQTRLSRYWLVPEDFASIQPTLAVATDGDTILVAAGTYRESLDFPVSVCIKSIDGPQHTIIQPFPASSSVISAVTPSTSLLTISGFTITGVVNSENAIHIDGPNYLIENNLIVGNYQCSNLVLLSSRGKIFGNRIWNNGGGPCSGIWVKECDSIDIAYNVIHENTNSDCPGIRAEGGRGVGQIHHNVLFGNVSTSGNCAATINVNGHLQIYNNTIVNNSSSALTSALWIWDSSSDVRNNIVASNQNCFGIRGASNCEYNDSWNNDFDNYSECNLGLGNIELNPEFRDAAFDDFQIAGNSPCIDAGDPSPLFDDSDGTRSDMGALAHLPENSLREVPSEYSTIQSAIDAANDGDTVLVYDGHYYEHISFLGKSIFVSSRYILDLDTMHMYQTIIDGDTLIDPIVGDTGSVVRFVNGGLEPAFLVGFTIQGGVDAAHGAGISASPGSNIRHCRVVNNNGDGIRAGDYQIFIDSCLIASNTGCGIFGKTGSINGCDIVLNGSHGIETNSGSYHIANTRFIGNNGNGVKTLREGTVYGCLFEENLGGIGRLEVAKDGSEAEFGRADPRQGTEFKNTIFRNNGFGVYGYEWLLIIDSCLFEDNGYGVKAGNESHAVITNCVFRRNGDSSSVGGAIRYGGSVGAYIDCSNSLFEGNIARLGGVIGQNRCCSLVFTSCTFADNYAELGSVIYKTNAASNPTVISDCVITANRGGAPFYRVSLPDSTQLWSDSTHFKFTCSNMYGNEGGDWIDTLSVQLGTNGNISADPLLCDTASGDYTIRDSSPCAPLNNSCGTLIGAYGIGCANAAPALTSSETVDAYSGLPFSYQPTATDVDGPALNYVFQFLPSWLSVNADSAFGTPPLTDVDTSFLSIVSDGFLADSQVVTVKLTETPLLSGLRVEDDSLALHVLSHVPMISWQYHDLIEAYPQTQIEIAVGSDSNWSHAELWNPAPFSGDDSAIVYAGAALIDGQTYWLRVRVKNDLLWSNWKQTMFRLNSLPTIPTPLSPIGGVAVSSTQPTLVTRNSSDAENDSLRYIFEISSDSTMAGAHVFEKTADADSITSALVDIGLDENARYFWRVKTSDYYEQSGYSEIGSFYVNAANSAPSVFDLTSPPNTMVPPLATKSPTLDWTTASDLDPLDQVTYTLHLAIDSNFAFVNQIPGLDSSRYTPPTPLEWGTGYWWKVRALDLHGGETWSSQVYRFRTMTLGDANGSGAVSISDAVFLIAYIFGGGPAPNPVASGDANCNGSVSISDVVYLINFIFGGGPAPCEH